MGLRPFCGVLTKHRYTSQCLANLLSHTVKLLGIGKCDSTLLTGHNDKITMQSIGF